MTHPKCLRAFADTIRRCSRWERKRSRNGPPSKNPHHVEHETEHSGASRAEQKPHVWSSANPVLGQSAPGKGFSGVLAWTAAVVPRMCLRIVDRAGILCAGIAT